MKRNNFQIFSLKEIFSGTKLYRRITIRLYVAMRSQNYIWHRDINSRVLIAHLHNRTTSKTERKKQYKICFADTRENITLLNCREEETGVALINLKVERARRRASLADRFLRGVTQFLDVLVLGAVSFRKIHELDEPSRQYPLWVMTPGPWQRNAGREREERPFHRPFHWLRSNTALLAFFFRLASISRSFKCENGLTNDDDESSSPSLPPPSSSSSSSVFCLHIVKHICLVLWCRAVVNLSLDSLPFSRI